MYTPSASSLSIHVLNLFKTMTGKFITKYTKKHTGTYFNMPRYYMHILAPFEDLCFAFVRSIFGQITTYCI